MAITAYTGLPGSGKSYGVVENVILPGLNKGRRIWTNIPLNQELLNESFPNQVTAFDIAEITANPAWFQETFEPGATLVLDECWRLWASGLKANNMAEGHKSFLAEHRHMVGSDGNSTEIVLVTQDLAQLASYPRNLVDTTYRATKLNAVGMSNRFRIDVYEGSVTGPNPPVSKRLRQIPGKYKEEVYKWYTSQTMSEAGGHGDESQTDSRKNILGGAFFTLGLPGVVVAGCLVMWLGWKAVTGFFGHDEAENGSDPDQAAAELPDSRPNMSQPAIVAKPKHHHFYQGKTPYIAFNMGRSPFIEYRIGFYQDDQLVVLDETQLARMGYRVIGYDQCYAQLVGYGDTLHVFCESHDPNKSEPPPAPIPTLDL